MSHKKKLFVISDAAVVPTGFGRVAEAVLDRLYDTGEWDIAQLGINYYDEYHSKPYRIFAASATNQFDWLGYSRVKKLYEEFEPDAVWVFQDFWHIAQYLQHSPNMKGLVSYFPVDAPNVKAMWSMPLAASVQVCTYTDFAANEVAKSMRHNLQRVRDAAVSEGKDSLKFITLDNPKIEGVVKVPARGVIDLCNPANIEVIPHGVDHANFYPMDKKKVREELGLPLDKFIVGNVNRNQQRKRLDLSVRGFAEFAKDKDDVIMLFHDPIKQKEGWDLEQLASERYDVGSKVIISSENLPVEILNKLYNAVDVMINTGGGEGFGLCSAESAQCKVPQIVPNWSATAEIWGNSGLLLDVVSVRHEIGGINTEQCVIDTDHLAECLNKLYEDSNYRKQVGEACYQEMQDPKYSWDNIATRFNEIFTRAAEQQYPEYTLENVVEQEYAVAI